MDAVYSVERPGVLLQWALYQKKIPVLRNEAVLGGGGGVRVFEREKENSILKLILDASGVRIETGMNCCPLTSDPTSPLVCGVCFQMGTYAEPTVCYASEIFGARGPHAKAWAQVQVHRL